MKTYRHKTSGQVISIGSELIGGDWELIQDAKKEENKKPTKRSRQVKK